MNHPYYYMWLFFLSNNGIERALGAGGLKCDEPAEGKLCQGSAFKIKVGISNGFMILPN